MGKFSYRQGANVSAGGGNKMSDLIAVYLEEVIAEVAAELAIGGECDVPMDNQWNGVDLVACGSYENFKKDAPTYFCDGVRLAIEDETLHIYKFESYGVSAIASFKGRMISSSVIVAIVKEWI
jgi:hypothetical protein